MHAAAKAQCQCDECQSRQLQFLSDEELNDLLDNVKRHQHVLQSEQIRRHAEHLGREQPLEQFLSTCY